MAAKDTKAKIAAQQAATRKKIADQQAATKAKIAARKPATTTTRKAGSTTTTRVTQTGPNNRVDFGQGGVTPLPTYQTIPGGGGTPPTSGGSPGPGGSSTPPTGGASKQEYAQRIIDYYREKAGTTWQGAALYDELGDPEIERQADLMARGELAFDTWSQAADRQIAENLARLTPGTGTGGGSSTTPGKGTQEQRDAFSQLTSLLDEWGLSGLTNWLWGQITAGNPRSQVMLDFRKTPEFRQRFWVIDSRRKAGLTPVSPAEVVAYERALSEQFAALGLKPPSQAEAQNLLLQDRSMAEVKQDLDAYAELQKNPFIRQQFFDVVGVDPTHEGLLGLALGLAPDLEARFNEKAAQFAGIPGPNSSQAGGQFHTLPIGPVEPVSLGGEGQVIVDDFGQNPFSPSGPTVNRLDRLRALALAERAHKAQFTAGGEQLVRKELSAVGEAF